MFRASQDSDFAKKVAWVLVESGSGVQNGLKGFSPDTKFRQAEFAPYPNKDVEWNPTGSGIMSKAYNFPVFLLSQASTLILQQAMIENDKRCYASFDLVIQALTDGRNTLDFMFQSADDEERIMNVTGEYRIQMQEDNTSQYHTLAIP